MIMSDFDPDCMSHVTIDLTKFLDSEFDGLNSAKFYRFLIGGPIKI